MPRLLLVLSTAFTFLIFSPLACAQDPVQQSFEKINKYEQQKNYDSAIILLEEVAARQWNAGLYEDYLNTITRTSTLLTKQRNYDQALKVLTGNEKAILARVDTTGVAAEKFFDALSDVYHRKGDALTSLQYHKKVYDINLRRQSPGAEKMQDLHRIMGVLHLNTAQYIKAIDYFHKYLDVTKSLDGEFSITVANAYNYLGIAHRHLGEVDLARAYYEQAITLCERYSREERAAVSPSFTYIAPLYNNLGNIYGDEGKFDQALRFFQMAVNDVPPGASNVPVMNGWYRNIGVAYDELGDFAMALQHKQKAGELAVIEYGAEHGVVAKNLLSIGDTYLHMKAYGKAHEQFLAGLRMTLDIRSELHPQTASCYLRLAKAEHGLRNFEQGLSWCQKAFEVLIPGFDTAIHNNPLASIGGNNRSTLLDVLTVKASILFDAYQKSHDNKLLVAAWETSKRGIELSRNFRHEVSDKASKTLLAENAKTLYEKALESTLARYQQTHDYAFAAFALEVMEENKSGLLIEAIQEAKSRRNLSVPDSLTDLESGLRKEIARCEQGILDEAVRGHNTDSARLNEYEESLFNSRHALAQLMNYYKQEVPQYFLGKYSEATVSLKALQNEILKPGDRFIEFFTADTTIYILSADRESQHLQRISGRIYNDLREALSILQQIEPESYYPVASRLFKQLVPPMLAGAKNIKRLIVVPDGLLSSFPFEALPDSEDASATYLLERYAVNYQYSAALMKSTSGIHRAENGVLAMAPEFSGFTLASRKGQGGLPYAKQEVDAIMTIFSGSKFTDEDATEKNFKQLANRYNILHLATHALIDTLNPDRSFLYLAGDSTGDGRLYAYELFNMQLKANMVTLSACNTAVGRWNEGEGAMSLARAFAYAGCPSMVTSLWPAQDQTTASVMAYFYENLSEGMRKDEALRQAKLRFLKEADKVTRHPYFWAGFIQIGNDLPLKRNSDQVYYWVGSLLLMLSASVFYFKRRKVRPAGS
ncbi:MAG TPA: CHAT domain-containing tetratricopeptide repeat protein [Chryseosolibacter sp.]